MASKYETLLARVNEIYDLTKAMALLSWDRQVNMPVAGATARTQQLTTLNGLIHERFTSDEMGELIEAAGAECVNAVYDSVEASLIRYLRRTYADERKLPLEYVRRSTEVSGSARQAWLKAREDADYGQFRPYLAQIVALVREKAELYGFDDETYDPLLDKYELGMKTAEVRATFDAVKRDLVPLRHQIEEKGPVVDDSMLHQKFDVGGQQRFARYIAAAVGYDFQRGHLGTAVHPFATSFSRDDARITSRWYPEFLNASLFGTLHESGHAMYEQGTHADLARTPLARGTSSGIHESQSRLIENLVGRSLGFWKAHYPTLQASFPAQLSPHTLETFYRAINKVHASYIRVEADELTYNFHIILRFELEQDMLNGDLDVADLPGAWSEKMDQLLGVVPPDDSLGCLQDIHWSSPGFGYFPTYALGNLYAAQFYEAAVSQEPTIAEEMALGKTHSLLSWLRENVHQHGRKFSPGELIQRATGAPLSHEPFVRYVTAKFAEICGL